MRVGASANTLMYQDQLKMDQRGGVIVDATQQTSVHGVYAIGDTASFPSKMYKDFPARRKHVVNARQTAQYVVGSVLGNTEAYDYLPYFFSRVLSLSWKFYGDSEVDCTVIGVFNPKLLAIWSKDGIVNNIIRESPTDKDTT